MAISTVPPAPEPANVISLEAHRCRCPTAMGVRLATGETCPTHSRKPVQPDTDNGVHVVQGALLDQLDEIVMSWNLRQLGGQTWTRAEVLDALCRWACITDVALGGDPARICEACDGVGLTP